MISSDECEHLRSGWRKNAFLLTLGVEKSMKLSHVNGRCSIVQDVNDIVEVPRPSALKECSGLLCEKFLEAVCCDHRLLGKKVGKRVQDRN